MLAFVWGSLEEIACQFKQKQKVKKIDLFFYQGFPGINLKTVEVFGFLLNEVTNKNRESK